MNSANRAALAAAIVVAAAGATGSREAEAEGLKPIEYTLEDGTVVRFSGQINMGILHYDDGRDDFTDFVDNDNSSSRVRLQFFSTPGDWKMEGTLEAEYQPLASNVISQFDDDPNWDFPATNIRKAEIALAHERFGKLWLGQGSMASDGVAEVDNSGTAIIAYSALSDTAGGYFFRFAGAGLSNVTVGGAFSNFDGLGRKLRVRYDTPTVFGVGLRTSYGEDTFGSSEASLYDVAGTFSRDFDQFEIDGAVGYAWNDGSKVDLLSGSVSALHKPSGLSLTLAAGREYSEGIEGRYGYAKIGYRHDFFAFGPTSFSLDYYHGEDIAEPGSSSSSVGLAAVQNVDDMNLQLWMLWRNYSYDNDPVGYDDGQAFFGGALFKF